MALGNYQVNGGGKQINGCYIQNDIEQPVNYIGVLKWQTC